MEEWRKRMQEEVEIEDGKACSMLEHVLEHHGTE